MLWCGKMTEIKLNQPIRKKQGKTELVWLFVFQPSLANNFSSDIS